MKNKLKTLLSISFFGLISLISILFVLGFGIGYSIGRFFIKRMYEGKSRLKPIIFHMKNWEIHLHHWFLSLLLLGIIYLTGIYSKLPSFLYGFLGGLIVQDIHWDKKLYKKHIYWRRKWYKILSRK